MAGVVICSGVGGGATFWTLDARPVSGKREREKNEYSWLPRDKSSLSFFLFLSLPGNKTEMEWEKLIFSDWRRRQRHGGASLNFYAMLCGKSLFWSFSISTIVEAEEGSVGLSSSKLSICFQIRDRSTFFNLNSEAFLYLSLSLPPIQSGPPPPTMAIGHLSVSVSVAPKCGHFSFSSTLQ